MHVRRWRRSLDPGRRTGWTVDGLNLNRNDEDALSVPRGQGIPFASADTRPTVSLSQTLSQDRLGRFRAAPTDEIARPGFLGPTRLGRRFTTLPIAYQVGRMRALGRNGGSTPVSGAAVAAALASLFGPV